MTEGTAYDDKGAAYFAHSRQDLLALLPPGTVDAVLEIGAGDGATLHALKASGRARHVTGVELTRAADAAGHLAVIDEFRVADVEQDTLPFAPASFDLLICADVLEHLRDPWAVLQGLVGFLRPGGVALISLPNIRYWRALHCILRGDFRYAPTGVLDRTHLRFFAKRNMQALIEGAGLVIEADRPSFLGQAQLRRDRQANALTLGLFEAFFAQQYLFRARKPV